MNDEIMVSVSCLVYNHVKYLRKCLDGFVMQKTNFKFEVLIHDDASTDGSQKIIKEYEEKYPDIIKPIYQTENQYSKNVAISKTYQYPRVKGRYVAVCEGDDYWCDENKLQKQVDFLLNNPDYSACVHNTVRYNCKTNEQTLFSNLYIDEDVPIEDVFLRTGLKFHTSSVMMKKEYYLRPEAFMAKSFGDYPSAIYLAINGKIRYLSDVMSVYRFFSMGSWSEKKEAGGVQRDIEHHKSVIELMESIDKYTENRFHDIIETVIIDNQVDIYEDIHDFRNICKQKKYRDNYLSKCTKSGKIMMIIGYFFPRLIKKYYNRKIDRIRK